MLHVLFNGVLPVFVVAALGYVMGIRGVFDSVAASAINKLVFLVAVPALGFRLLVNAPFEEFDWFLLIGLLLSELITYGVGFTVSRWVFNLELKESILLGLAAAFGNTLLFVLPIALALFGDGATLPIVAIIAFDSILIFGGTIVIIEALSADHFSYSGLCKDILLNPPLVSMLLAILFVILSIDIPDGLNVFLKFLGNIAAPSSLFSLGIILSQTKLSGQVSPALSISVLKLLVYPILAWVILLEIFGFTLIQAKTSMMVAAAPCGTMAFVLALNYNVRCSIIASAILLTTIGSLVSVTIVAAW